MSVLITEKTRGALRPKAARLSCSLRDTGLVPPGRCPSELPRLARPPPSSCHVRRIVLFSFPRLSSCIDCAHGHMRSPCGHAVAAEVTRQGHPVALTALSYFARTAGVLHPKLNATLVTLKCFKSHSLFRAAECFQRFYSVMLWISLMLTGLNRGDVLLADLLRYD